MTTTLVLGGARSGKSRYAESLLPGPALYVATAEPGDPEMAERIARHRARRGAGWRTVEAPHDVAGVLVREPEAPALVDCVTFWLSNALTEDRKVDLAGLCAALTFRTADTVLVSNEVGSGVVPGTGLGRRFRDAQGDLNRELAAVADRVVLVVAGLPLELKAPC